MKVRRTFVTPVVGGESLSSSRVIDAREMKGPGSLLLDRLARQMIEAEGAVKITVESASGTRWEYEVQAES